MRIDRLTLGTVTVLMLGGPPHAMSQARGVGQESAPSRQEEMTRKLLARLDLEKYKATIKALAQFGDRRQGTERNRKAVDWIGAQLRSYGCPTERVHYNYDPPPPRAPRPAEGTPFEPVIASGEVRLGPGGSRYRGIQRPTGVNTDPEAQPDARLR